MRTFQAGRVSTAVLGLLLCPLAAHALFVGHERNGHGWSHLFQAGRDGFNGTEMVHLVAHKGSLYGGIGYWMNPVHRALEIARLDSPTGQWVFDGYPNPWAGRPELLKSITWTTDASGNPLTSPENILIAGYYLKWGDEARLFIAARLDDTQEWREKMYYSQTPWRERYFSARAAVLHQDAVTGVDHLFFTTGIPGIIRGSYDAVTETHVSFDQSPESGAFPTRPLGLVVVNGRLYTAGGSFIRRRNDGPSPSWDIVFDMADHSSDTVDEAVGGIRGLSMIPGPAGGESLFFAWCPNGNSRGCMVRVDIDGDTYTHTEEACVPDLAQEPLGGDTFITYTIANYNFPLPITTPGGGLVHIIGYQILLYGKSSVDRHPTTSQVAWINGQPLAYYAGAGYLIRKSATDYEARVPGGPRFCPGEVSPAFVAVRSLAHSPFAGDDSVYMGGYDCNNYVSSNTAWILQGTIDAVYAQPVEYGNRQCTTVTRTTTTHTSTSTSTLTTTLACGLCYLKNYAPHWVERSDFGVQLSKGNVTNAGNTLDGDPETSGSAKELIFDLRHDHHITAIEVDFSDCDCSQADSVIVSQWSYSQEQWENVASPTLDTSQGMVSRTFTLNVVSRYFRVAATDTNPTWRVGVSEVRLFGTQNVWGGHPQALAHSNWAGNDNGADFTCSQAEDHANLPDPGYTCDRARRWWASLCCVPAPTPAPTTTTTETTTTMSTTTLTISTTTISTGTTTTSTTRTASTTTTTTNTTSTATTTATTATTATTTITLSMMMTTIATTLVVAQTITLTTTDTTTASTSTATAATAKSTTITAATATTTTTFTETMTRGAVNSAVATTTVLEMSTTTMKAAAPTPQPQPETTSQPAADFGNQTDSTSATTTSTSTLSTSTTLTTLRTSLRRTVTTTTTTAAGAAVVTSTTATLATSHTTVSAAAGQPRVTTTATTTIPRSSVSTSTVTGEQATTTTTTPADLPPEEVVTGIFDVVVSLPDQFVLDESVKDFILAFMAFLVTLPVERININFLQGDRGRLLNVPDVQLPAPTGAVRVGYVITVPRDRTKPSVVLPLQAAGSDLEGTSQDFADLSRQYGVDQTYSMAVVRLEVEDDESPITTGAPAIVDVPVARGEEKTSASVGLVMGILCSLGFLVGTTALVCYVRKRRRRLALVVPEAWPTKQLSINGLLTPEAWGPAKQPSLKDLSSNQAVSPQMGEKLSEKLDEKEPQKAEDRLSERSISTPSTPPSVVAVAVFSPRTKPADKQRRDRVMTLE